MKKIIMLAACFAALQLNAQTISSGVNMDSLFKAKEQESAGMLFPQFVAMAGKQEICNTTLEGKIVFVNFWFEACPPCIAEMDALNALYKKFHADTCFEFISFTHEQAANIPMLKRRHRMAYKVASVSNNECYRLNQNNGFPTSIIIGKDGRIIRLFTGGTTNRKEAAAFIRHEIYPILSTALHTTDSSGHKKRP